MKARRAGLGWMLGSLAAVVGISSIPAVAAFESPAVPPTRVPTDFIWVVVAECAAVLGPGYGVTEFSLGGTGDAPRVGVSRSADGPNPKRIPDDSRETRLVQACVEQYAYDPLPSTTRAPTAQEWLVGYQWAAEFTRPCLIAHGLRPAPLEYEEFAPSTARGYSSLWVSYLNHDSDLDDLLSIRLACPHVPPHLASTWLGR